MNKPMPVTADGKDITFEEVLSALPPEFPTNFFQASFSYFLTDPSENTLTRIAPLATLYPEVHKKFQAELAVLSAEIKRRDQADIEANYASYPYLDPERVPASIDI
jgi:hypothetical protein